MLRKEVMAAELHGAVPAAAKVLPRLHNHPTAFRPISAILADQVGRLVAIRGTVTRATPARPLVTQMQVVGIGKECRLACYDAFCLLIRS